MVPNAEKSVGHPLSLETRSTILIDWSQLCSSEHTRISYSDSLSFSLIFFHNQSPLILFYFLLLQTHEQVQLPQSIKERIWWARLGRKSSLWSHQQWMGTESPRDPPPTAWGCEGHQRRPPRLLKWDWWIGEKMISFSRSDVVRHRGMVKIRSSRAQRMQDRLVWGKGMCWIPHLTSLLICKLPFSFLHTSSDLLKGMW